MVSGLLGSGVNWNGQPRKGESSGNGECHAREGFVPNPQAPLREQVREVIRFHHYALRTERAYWHWIVRFLRHLNMLRVERNAPPANHTL